MARTATVKISSPTKSGMLHKQAVASDATEDATTNKLNARETADGPKLQQTRNRGIRMANIPIMAIISPLGHCVVYRKNGNPRFICSEYGGCLCDEKGAAYFQWKWEDVRNTQYDKFKYKLLLDVSFVSSFKQK